MGTPDAACGGLPIHASTIPPTPRILRRLRSRGFRKHCGAGSRQSVSLNPI